MKSGSKMWERKVKGTGEPREAWERGRVRSDLPLRKIKGRGPGKPSLEAGPGGRRPRTQRRLPQDLAAPGRGQEGEREPVPGSQKPAAKEPGEAGAIFSSRSSGRLIAAAASRQAAMETLNATAGSLGLSQSARPAPRPRARTLRGRGRGGAPPASRTAPSSATRGRLCPSLGFHGRGCHSGRWRLGAWFESLPGQPEDGDLRPFPTVFGVLVSHF